MKTRLLQIIFIYSLLHVASANATDTSAINWHNWSQDSLSQAKKTNRLVFISLTAEWCQFCKKMALTTYKDKAVIDELSKHYIAIKADEASSPEIVKRFAKVGFPGSIILNEKGDVLLTKTGYLKPQWMLWTLQAVANDVNENNG